MEGKEISGGSQEKDLSVIVPVYNEERLIFKSLWKIRSVLHGLDMSYELIVVNDGSQDNTHGEVLRYIQTTGCNLKLINNPYNQGKGFAIRHGCKFATGRLITFVDADLDINPNQITVFLEYMKNNKADVVVGSKRHPLSKINYPVMRRFLSIGYNIFVKLLFHLSVTDTQAGLKLAKREVLQKILEKIVVKKYAFDLELLVNAHKSGYKIVEAPITLKFRRKFSRIRPWDLLKMVLDTMAIFYRLRILKYYDRHKVHTITPDMQ